MIIPFSFDSAFAALPPACVGCEEDAQESPSIFVFTDKSVYNRGEQIKVHGSVEEIRTGTPVTATVISPTDNIVSINQLTVNK